MKMHVTSYTLNVYGDNGGYFEFHRDFVGNMNNERLIEWVQEEVARMECEVYAVSVTNAFGKNVMGWSRSRY